jgi:hypothetical protein
MPFGPYNPDGSLHSGAQTTEMFDELTSIGVEGMRDRHRAWRDEALSLGLDEPVLDWCRRFGLLGVPDIDSGAIQGEMRLSPGAGPIRSRLDDIRALTSDPQFWKTYEEPFAIFANRAVWLDWALRGTEHPDRVRRSESRESLNLLLEPVGLVVADDDGRTLLRVTSSSLLGYLAAMASFDLAGGVRLGVCERCGALFSTRRRDRRTCSTRCQEAAKKKRRRDDPEYRKRELKRQRDARARERDTDEPGSGSRRR